LKLLFSFGTFFIGFEGGCCGGSAVEAGVVCVGVGIYVGKELHGGTRADSLFKV
jgi:hypothetical protein